MIAAISGSPAFSSSFFSRNSTFSASLLFAVAFFTAGRITKTVRRTSPAIRTITPSAIAVIRIFSAGVFGNSTLIASSGISPFEEVDCASASRISFSVAILLFLGFFGALIKIGACTWILSLFSLSATIGDSWRVIAEDSALSGDSSGVASAIACACSYSTFACARQYCASSVICWE